MITNSTAKVWAMVGVGLALATAARGQGNLSTQGFGYPQGQLTSRSLATGGALGEVDPTTPLNPAAMGRLTTRTVLFQIEPEYRTLLSGSAKERTTTARYPVIFAGVPFGERWVTSVSSSTLLDRSWQTSTPTTEIIGLDTVETTLHESSNGAMNDVRVAEAWSNRTWLYIGVGVHGITGRNVVSSGQDFPDSTHFTPFSSSRTISYTGSAFSAGVQLVASDQATIGLTYRKGGSLRARTNDSTLVTGSVPDHFGVSAAYTGIRGTLLAARAGHDNWSTMGKMLETPGQTVHDSWDLGIGSETAGPHFASQTMLIRLGYRTRTLPFEASSKAVTEHSLSFGSGLSLGRGRMSADITGVRQWRVSDVPSVKERAWTLSISLTARP